MAVKARMRVNSIEDFGQNGGRNIKFVAITGGGSDDPNYSWSKYTPAGALNLTITNPDAYDQFKVGKIYELTFNEVD